MQLRGYLGVLTEHLLQHIQFFRMLHSLPPQSIQLVLPIPDFLLRLQGITFSSILQWVNKIK